MDGKQRYSHKPKTETFILRRKKRDTEVSFLPRESGTEEPLNSEEGTEHQLQKKKT